MYPSNFWPLRVLLELVQLVMLLYKKLVLFELHLKGDMILIDLRYKLMKIRSSVEVFLFVIAHREFVNFCEVLFFK